ncbi:MAG: hypothetical protein QOG57_2871 [Pseudonocardiales bacterium]|nr:hypothetical protein [Pseudonocardiales bacterium]
MRARAAATVDGAGGPRSAAGSAAAKRALRTLPTTATPSALPSSRATLCSPEPSPTRSADSADSTPSDSGGVASPQPAAMTVAHSAYHGYGVAESAKEAPSRPTASAARPRLTAVRGPNRRTIGTVALGASHSPAAIGSSRTPAPRTE